MSPAFTILDLTQTLNEARMKAGTIRAEVIRMEKSIEEIAKSEDNQSALVAEVERLQAEFLKLLGEVPAELENRFAEVLNKAAELDLAQIVALEGGDKKPAADGGKKPAPGAAAPKK